MEGISHEAASLAGHLKLGKLICLYDDNRISIEGSTDIAYTEDRTARFAAYGWHVQTVADGNDLAALEAAVEAARIETGKPSFIAIKTHIGYGSPAKQDTAAAHGEPLGAEETKAAKQRLNWPAEPAFYVPDEALSRFRGALQKGKTWENDWNSRLEKYTKAYPEESSLLQAWLSGRLPRGWETLVPSFPPDKKGVATRAASGTVLNALAGAITNLMGGSADLAPSNKTVIKGEKDFQTETPSGRNIRFGVREHGMGGILNGMALHGGIRPYGGTFLIFSDYMRPAIRLAALMELNTIYVFTHDSIGLGEDGPTHQPIEQLAALRAIPNLTVIRPADANETAEAWKAALAETRGPVALALTRQSLPVLDRKDFAGAEGLHKGAYVLKDAGKEPHAILIATGSEVQIAIDAAAALAEKGVKARVVSMPSWELFERQDAAYRETVLPPGVKCRVAVEAGCSLGWARYTGERGAFVGIDRFGASAPYKILYEKFSITAAEVVSRILELLKMPS
jgi:transketolase